jgi:hypothetical protein
MAQGKGDRIQESRARRQIIQKLSFFSGYRLLITGYLSLYDLNEFAEGERLNVLNGLNDLNNGRLTTDSRQ